MLLVVASVIAAIASVGLDERMRAALDHQICVVVNGQTNCALQQAQQAKAAVPDQDHDGLSDATERRLHTRVGQADSDRDGLLDGDEVRRHTDPNASDTDSDGLSDAREIRLAAAGRGTFDPRSADGDHDTLTDAQELAIGTPPDQADFDLDGHGGLSDGLSDGQEVRIGTDPKRIDTDGDGASDGDEVRAHTNPLLDERSLGRKVSLAALGFLLDDPSNLSPKGIAKGAGKLGAKALRKVLRIGAKDAAKEAAQTTEKALAAAAERQAAVRRAAPQQAPARSEVVVRPAQEPRRIHSARELRRRADDPGPNHNFPASVDKSIFDRGERTIVRGYFKRSKPGYSDDSIQYRLRGHINGRAGIYEIFVRPSRSGRTEVVIHRFFRQDR